MGWSSNMSTTNQYIVYQVGITQNSQSITNNTSNVTVQVWVTRTNSGYTTYGAGTVYCRINGSVYSASITPSQKITNSGIYIFSTTLNIPHNSDGTKTLTCSAWISHERFSSNEQSYSQTLSTIPRKSELAASNGTLGTTQTLTVTRKSTSFTHTITYTCGSYSGTICDKSTSTSISWTPPLEFANGEPNGGSVYISLKIETFNGSTSIGSNTSSITCAIPTSVVPTVSFTVGDSMGYLSTYSDYVQTKSKFQIAITAGGVYSSTIKSYSTSVDGKTFSDASFTTDVIKNSGTLTITVTVIDSRGRTATASKTVTVLAYVGPKISSFSVKRCNSSGVSDSSGAYLGLTFSASVTSLNSKNTAAYVVKYKKKTDSSYTSATLSSYAGSYSVSNGSYVFAASTSSSYDVILEVTDAFSTANKSGEGSPITKLFSWLNRGLGWAFGKVAEIENALDVAWDTYIRKNLYVTGSVKASSGVYDGFDTMIRNGAAAYTGSGTSNAIDPNTTTEHLILTDVNVPMSGFCYIMTFFYSTKSDSTDRAQFAIPYSTNNYVYHRYYYNGSWSDWENNESISDSGWQTLASSGTAFIKYRKKSGFVTVAGTSFGSYSVSAKSYYTFSTALPSEFRPAINVITAGVSRSNTGYELQAEVSSAGVVRVYNSNPNAAINYWGFNITYPV